MGSQSRTTLPVNVLTPRLTVIIFCTGTTVYRTAIGCDTLKSPYGKTDEDR